MSNKADALKEHRKWLVKIFIVTFILSAIFNSTATEAVENLNIGWSFVILVLVIIVGIVSDMLATAVTAANEVPFHAKAADKKKGAKEAVKLIKNADKVSNVCGDVVGDICGVLSGATGALIAVTIANNFGQSDVTLSTLIVTATITAVTVLGKGIGKRIGIDRANDVLDVLGKIIAFLKIKK